MSREKFSPLSGVDDLPEELVKELNLDNSPDIKILQVLKEGGGKLNLSELLIGYYKIHNEIKTRRFMMSACSRMARKGMIESTGKKGEYQIPAVKDDFVGTQED